jgi:hypothetical protein
MMRFFERLESVSIANKQVPNANEHGFNMTAPSNKDNESKKLFDISKDTRQGSTEDGFDVWKMISKAFWPNIYSPKGGEENTKPFDMTEIFLADKGCEEEEAQMQGLEGEELKPLYVGSRLLSIEFIVQFFKH